MHYTGLRTTQQEIVTVWALNLSRVMLHRIQLFRVTATVWAMDLLNFRKFKLRGHGVLSVGGQYGR